MGLRLSRVSIFLQTIIISCSETRAVKARFPSSGGQIWSGKAIYAEEEEVNGQTEEEREGGEAEHEGEGEVKVKVVVLMVRM